MTALVGIAGSLRSGSFNAALLHATQNLMPPGDTLDIATIKGIALYDGDLEASLGLPPAAVALKEKIAACDGLLLVTPEYSSAIPGVFKNAIDWCSRPVADIPRVFGNRPTAVIGASPSGFGTISCASPGGRPAAEEASGTVPQARMYPIVRSNNLSDPFKRLIPTQGSMTLEFFCFNGFPALFQLSAPRRSSFITRSEKWRPLHPYLARPF